MAELHGAALAAHLKKLASEEVVVEHKKRELHGAALASHLRYVEKLTAEHDHKLHGAALESHLKHLEEVAEEHRLHGAALESHVKKVRAEGAKELHGAALASHLKHLHELDEGHAKKLYGAALAAHEKKLAEEIAKKIAEAPAPAKPAKAHHPKPKKPKHPKELAELVDHTLLTPEATEADVAELVEEGARLGVYAVCVQPTMVKHAARVADGRVKVASVAGFPSGTHSSEIKAAEARQAVDDGAHEIDMVINLGKVKEGKFEDVQRDIEQVRAAVPDAILKVIIESAALTDKEIVKASMAAELAGADFVKTSTGYHPAGGATPHAVALMSDTVGDRLGVKASGGVRTLEEAHAVIEQGATRIGMSGTAGVISGFGVVKESDADDSDGGVIASGESGNPVLGVGVTETGAADY